MAVGYRLEVVKENGFVKDKFDINQQELAENIKECVDMCGEDSDKLLDTLRTCHSLFNPSKIEFKIKES